MQCVTEERSAWSVHYHVIVRMMLTVIVFLASVLVVSVHMAGLAPAVRQVRPLAFRLGLERYQTRHPISNNTGL